MRSRYNNRNRRKYDLKAHIVLVTKYRKALLQNGIDDFVKRAICYLAKKTTGTSSLWKRTRITFMCF